MFVPLLGTVSRATTALIQGGLLIIFVYFFGIPSIERFISNEVLIVTSEAYPGKIPLPAVTVVYNNASTNGWEALKKFCVESGDLRSCIQENTHSLSETVHAELGFDLRESLMAPQLWREDFTDPLFGRSYTLVYPHRRANNWRTDDINLHVNNSDGITRRIFIHDPDFFVLTSNPLTIPMTMLLVTPHSGRFYYSLALR